MYWFTCVRHEIDISMKSQMETDFLLFFKMLRKYKETEENVISIFKCFNLAVLSGDLGGIDKSDSTQQETNMF